jgi:tetratricopeptide (TPR) repeat protein
MDLRRKMDIVGSAECGVSLIWRAFAFLLFICGQALLGQVSPPPDPQIAQIKQLFAAEHWQEIVDLVAKVSAPSAELEFYYGSALGRLGRWEEARLAFLAGHHVFPKDERFLVELAGVAFKQKHSGEAAAGLRRALKLAPQDSYANDFLGTIYFLQGNLEAALKYWNRVDKPEIENIRSEPTPKLDSVLLDRAFTFSPAGILRVPDLGATEKRIEGLEIFPTYHLELQARDDGKFSAVFRNRELDGWGPNQWGDFFLLLRGLPAQTVYPEFFNFKGRGLNFTSMFRWDVEKRRIRTMFSGPLSGNPGRHFALAMDLRDENWYLYPSFTGPAPLLGAFKLRREALSANLGSFVSDRWTWFAGAEFSHRDFRNVDLGTALLPALLTRGYQLKQTTGVEMQIWRVPERRLTLAAGGSSQVGRMWSQSSRSFEKLQSFVLLHWFPWAQGDDYEMQEQIREGKTWGSVPFDELFALGIDADNDLWMRGHIASRDGRKGSAPLGRNYFLSNWELDKNVYSNGLLTLKLGPFLDTGKIIDPLPGLGSRRWLWDVGVQAKARVLGVEVILSYGKDLRTGTNAIYVTLR